MKSFSKTAPLLVLVLAFALRMYHLGANSLWYDETVSLYLAQSDLAELLRHTAGDIHPPLYYVLLHFWGRLAGWSEFSAAFLSLWFGMVLVAVVYRVTRKWFAPSPVGKGARIALVAALLVAVSPFNIWYSQEVRMYTLGATLGLLSVFFLRRMLAQPKTFSRDFFAYVVFTALGLYTLYYFVFLMVFEWLWVALRVLRIATGRSPGATSQSQGASPSRTLSSSLVTFFVSQLALMLLYLPWLPVAFRQATDPPVPPWREFIALPRVLLESLGALAFGQAVDPNIFGIAAWLLVIPIGVVLWREWKKRSAAKDSNFKLEEQPSAFFLLGYTFVPLAAIYLFSLWKPLYHVRYLYTYSPAFYILLAYAVVTLVSEFVQARGQTRAHTAYGLSALALVAGLGLLVVSGYSLYNFWHNEQYAEDDLRGAVSYIADKWRPGDVILVNAGYAYPALVYYFPETLTRERLVNYQTADGNVPLVLQSGSIDGAPNLGWGDPLSDFYKTNKEETRAALDRTFANHSRVWILRIYDTVVDPHGVIRGYLDEHATLLDDRAFSGESQTRVQAYIVQPPPSIPLTATHANVPLGDRVELAGYEFRSRDVTRDDYLDVVLYWKLLQIVNHNYQVSLQLLNASGENVAQFDETPLSEILPMTRWNVDEPYREPLRLKIPPSLAPGEYRVIVKLYEPRSGEVLGGLVELGSVQVR